MAKKKAKVKTAKVGRPLRVSAKQTAVGELLLKAIGPRDVREVAAAAGISHTVIYDSIAGKSVPTLRTIKAIDAALKLAGRLVSKIIEVL